MNKNKTKIKTTIVLLLLSVFSSINVSNAQETTDNREIPNEVLEEIKKVPFEQTKVDIKKDYYNPKIIAKAENSSKDVLAQKEYNIETKTAKETNDVNYYKYGLIIFLILIFAVLILFLVKKSIKKSNLIVLLFFISVWIVLDFLIHGEANAVSSSAFIYSPTSSKHIYIGETVFFDAFDTDPNPGDNEYQWRLNSCDGGTLLSSSKSFTKTFSRTGEFHIHLRSKTSSKSVWSTDCGYVAITVLTPHHLIPRLPPPPSLSASCDSSMNISLSYSSSNAIDYNIRINDLINSDPCGFNALCSQGTEDCPGDTCIDGRTSTSYTRSGIAGHRYDAWVSACNSAGCGRATRKSFSCPYPTPTPTPVNGSCGINATNYTYDTTSYPFTTNRAFCSAGTPSPIASRIAFPAQGSSQRWKCTGSSGGRTVTCLASRSAAPAPTNHLPQAVIDTPKTDQTITTGGSVPFSGRGTDSDGDAITAYRWRLSNCSSGTLLSSSSSFSKSFPSAGTYTIYLSVRDSKGAWSTNCPSRTITVVSPNQPPTAYIDSPASNITVNTSQSVSFKGHGTDPDGSITEYQWKCYLGGATMYEDLASFNWKFPTPGTYTMYFKVKDDDGAWSGWRSRTITVVSPTPTPVNGSCGTNARYYSYTTTSYPSTTNRAFCSAGTPSPIASRIAFPAQGSSQRWKCTGSSGGRTVTCLASRSAAPAPTNHLPQAVIDTPTTNRTITTGSSLSFSGHGTDSDGDAIIAYRWRLSNCSTGTLLSSSSSFSKSFPSAGTYTIYLSVRDSKGAWSTNCPSRTITVTKPITYSCTGTRPANTSIHSGDTTGLTANTSWAYSATNTSRKCQYYCNSGYTWNGRSCVLPAAPTPVNGSCGTNARYYSYTTTSYPSTTNRAFCSAGTPSPIASRIAFPAQGSSQRWKCTGSSGGTTVTCLASRSAAPAPTNHLPQAVIDTPTTNRTITTGSSLSFSGHGTDSDGDAITAYRWRLSNCSSGTLLSSSSSFSKSFPSAGTYTIYLSVRDSKGAWSTNCPSRTITVQSPTYSCTGTRPSHTSIHSGDTTGLTADTSWIYSATNTSRKCQYYCNSGYTWNGSLCRLNAFCGAADGEAYCDAPTKDLCANGSPSTVTSTGGNWTWTCSSVSGTTQDDASCSATVQTTGCGSPGNWQEVNP